jgi:hemerythrin
LFFCTWVGESFENCDKVKEMPSHTTHKLICREFDNKRERYARAIGQELTQVIKKYILQHSVQAEKGS